MKMLVLLVRVDATVVDVAVAVVAAAVVADTLQRPELRQRRPFPKDEKHFARMHYHGLLLASCGYYRSQVLDKHLWATLHCHLTSSSAAVVLEQELVAGKEPRRLALFLMQRAVPAVPGHSRHPEAWQL